jgi:hypothetical protein
MLFARYVVQDLANKQTLNIKFIKIKARKVVLD